MRTEQGARARAARRVAEAGVGGAGPAGVLSERRPVVRQLLLLLLIAVRQVRVPLALRPTQAESGARGASGGGNAHAAQRARQLLHRIRQVAALLLLLLVLGLPLGVRVGPLELLG